MRRALFGTCSSVRHLAHASNPAGSDQPLREEENMHPGMMHWWQSRHAREYAVHAGCGSMMAHAARWAAPPEHGDFGAGAFGVRRPLRYLAYKLELDERQVTELARILNELKTERAQAEVDRRRSLSAFADAVAGDAFDDAKAKQAAGQRVATAERLRDAVTSALGRLHALLDKDQRERLAYLIRTGVLAV